MNIILKRKIKVYLRNNWRKILFYALGAIAIVYALLNPNPQKISSNGNIRSIEQVKVIPAIEVMAKSEDVKPEIVEVKIDQTIEEEIIEVFGKYSDNALLLLKGKGEGTCAENRTIDPSRIHLNENGSKDYGVFQINDNWYGFNKAVNNPRFLLDRHLNIQLAWLIFESNGYTFANWACGKAYGI